VEAALLGSFWLSLMVLDKFLHGIYEKVEAELGLTLQQITDKVLLKAGLQKSDFIATLHTGTGPMAGSYQNCGCFPSSSLYYMETQDMGEASAQPRNPEILGVLVQHLQSYSDLPCWLVLNRGSWVVARWPTRGGQKLQTYIRIYRRAY
jgi:hypothetical protein